MHRVQRSEQTSEDVGMQHCQSGASDLMFASIRSTFNAEKSAPLASCAGVASATTVALIRAL